MQPAVARYREYAPCAALRPFVRSFFVYSLRPADAQQLSRRAWRMEAVCQADDLLRSRLFADAHVSLVCCVQGTYSIDGLWEPSAPQSHVIGAMSRSRRTLPSGHMLQTGVYFSAGQARHFFRLPGAELADRVISLADLWGLYASEFEDRVKAAEDESSILDALEAALLERLRENRRTQIDLAGLAQFSETRRGQVSVEELAGMAGVSRQYITRKFREEIGVGPKLYCRLARFRAAIAEPHDTRTSWADVALQSGYADQSHMIAEFQQFSGLTPRNLVKQQLFHPFRLRK